MLKADFHTHSVVSPDGGIKLNEYQNVLNDKLLDVVAITDHNNVSLALELHKNYPNQVIVGEEIMTSEGELVGLYLNKEIRPGMTAAETAKAIKDQGGLVYVPHPFETVRSGIALEVLDSIAKVVDIVEVHNGRAVFQNQGPAATTWAKLNHVAMAVSSDAHGLKGLGSTYTMIEAAPSAQTLTKLLASGRLITARPPLVTLLYPKANRLRKRFKK